MPKYVKNIITAISIGLVVYFIGKMMSGGFHYNNINEFFMDLLLYELYAFVLGFVNMTFHDLLSRRSWKPGTMIKKVVIGMFGSVVLTLIGLFFLRMFTVVVYLGKSLDWFLANDKFEDYQFGLWITLTIVITYHLIYFYNEYQKNKIKEQKVIAHTANAQFESLKNQIDPHFLFNSLNVLSSLIEENAENAQKFTVSLSKIYRYVLEQKDKELVSVEEELSFAKTYMNLLKMRFENSIDFEMPTYENIEDFKVVPLSLQLLLENTIKHNAASEAKPLNIKIFIENKYLVVQNNLQKKEVLQNRKGVGLQNIVNRYAILSQRKVLIEQSEERFLVKLPILTKQVEFKRTQYTYNEKESYNRAKKRVQDIKGFYGNFIAYIIIIPFLIFINGRTFWEFQWFWFPTVGWGMGVLFHAFQVFGYGKTWEDRKIKQILENEQQSKTWN